MDEVVTTLKCDGAQYAEGDESDVIAEWLRELARRR